MTFSTPIPPPADCTRRIVIDFYRDTARLINILPDGKFGISAVKDGEIPLIDMVCNMVKNPSYCEGPLASHPP